jgi:hypothetical protein
MSRFAFPSSFDPCVDNLGPKNEIPVAITLIFARKSISFIVKADVPDSSTTIHPGFMDLLVGSLVRRDWDFGGTDFYGFVARRKWYFAGPIAMQSTSPV